MALTSKLTAIADAIRAKTGDSAKLSLDAMPTAIASIETGGGGGASSVSATFNGAGAPNSILRYIDANNAWHEKICTTGNNVFDVKDGTFVVLFGNRSDDYFSGQGAELLYREFGNKYILINKGALSSVYFTFPMPPSCFLTGTLITMADGTRKPIEEITYDDQLLVWDFDEGRMGTAGVSWLTASGLMNDHYYRLTFSDGTVLCTTGQNSNHKLYSVDDRRFKDVVKLEEGERIFSEGGIVTLTAKEYVEEEVEYYNLMTDRKINCFANGILSSDRFGNLYPIAEDMTYVKEGRELRPFEEFEAVGIKRYWYDCLRLGESDITVEKALDYVRKCECQMLEPERVV